MESEARTTARPPLSTLMREVLALAAPTTLLAAVQSASLLFETWLAARQGTAAMAGWAVVLPFALLLQMMSAGAMGGGVVSAIARALGARRPEEAAALVLHAVLIAVAAGLAFAVILAGFPRPVLGLIGGPVSAEAAAAYAIWLFGLGAVPAWLANTLASVLRGGGRHALAAAAMLLTGLVYPALAFVLVEHAGMGLAGLGLAYALTMGAATLIQGAVVLAGVANLTTILVTARIKDHGPVAVAAYGISARLEFLMIPLAFGVGSALTALVGRAVGAGDWATARRIAWAGGSMALAVTGAAGLVVAVFPGATAAAFSRDPEVVAIATQALRYVGPALPGFGAGIAFYFAAMGAGRMRWPVAAGLARIGIAVGGGWLLADLLGWDLEGQFLAVALGVTAYGVITAAGVRPAVWPGR